MPSTGEWRMVVDAKTKQAIDSAAELIADLCRNQVLDALQAEDSWNALPKLQRSQLMSSLHTDIGTLVAEVVWQALRGRGTSPK